MNSPEKSKIPMALLPAKRRLRERPRGRLARQAREAHEGESTTRLKNFGFFSQVG
jgi:hypothetical protein